MNTTMAGSIATESLPPSVLTLWRVVAMPPTPPATRIHQTVLRELLTYQLAAAAPAVALMALAVVVLTVAVGLNAGFAAGAITIAAGAGALLFLLSIVVIGFRP